MQITDCNFLVTQKRHISIKKYVDIHCELPYQIQQQKKLLYNEKEKNILLK